MQDGTCDDCIFNIVTISDDEELIQKCRRYPPLIYFDGKEPCQTFPDAMIRCGEYKKEDS
jgi:hypothetical protein